MFQTPSRVSRQSIICLVCMARGAERGSLSSGIVECDPGYGCSKKERQQNTGCKTFSQLPGWDQGEYIPYGWQSRAEHRERNKNKRITRALLLDLAPVYHLFGPGSDGSFLGVLGSPTPQYGPTETFPI